MLDVSQNLLDKFHRFRCGHPPINAHHYGWPIVDLARGDVPAMFEMPRQQVYLLLSAAADFDVTQAVDITKGVHGLIDLSIFQQLPAYERTIRDIRTYADDASQTHPTPAVNIPLETADGLPCGACLIGPAGSDKSLIDLAKELYRGME